MVQYVSYGKGQPTWATKPHTRQCSTGGQVFEWWRVRPWIKWSLVRSPSGRKSSCHCLTRAENSTEVYTFPPRIHYYNPFFSQISRQRSYMVPLCHDVSSTEELLPYERFECQWHYTMHHHRVRITITR